MPTEKKKSTPKAAAAKKTEAKMPEAKKTEAKKTEAKHKPNALQQPLKPSKELAAVIGEGTMARAEIVSKIWEYIKSKNLQNPANRREIIADEKLRKVFGQDKATMFEMNKLLSKHLS
jgi:upstream activation factor subunit UAF30